MEDGKVSKRFCSISASHSVPASSYCREYSTPHLPTSISMVRKSSSGLCPITSIYRALSQQVWAWKQDPTLKKVRPTPTQSSLCC